MNILRITVAIGRVIMIPRRPPGSPKAPPKLPPAQLPAIPVPIFAPKIIKAPPKAAQIPPPAPKKAAPPAVVPQPKAPPKSARALFKGGVGSASESDEDGGDNPWKAVMAVLMETRALDPRIVGAIVHNVPELRQMINLHNAQQLQAAQGRRHAITLPKLPPKGRGPKRKLVADESAHPPKRYGLVNLTQFLADLETLPPIEEEFDWDTAFKAWKLARKNIAIQDGVDVNVMMAFDAAAPEEIKERFAREQGRPDPNPPRGNGARKQSKAAKKAAKTAVHSIVFKKSDWTIPKAKKWLRDHAFKIRKIHETEDSYRFRQINPDKFSRFITKQVMSNGKAISLVIGFWKK